MRYVLLYFAPSGALLLLLAACKLHDRLRDWAYAPYGGRLAVASAGPPRLPSFYVCERAWAADSSAAVEVERLRSGSAFAEAMLVQLLELRALPEVAS